MGVWASGMFLTMWTKSAVLYLNFSCQACAFQYLLYWFIVEGFVVQSSSLANVNHHHLRKDSNNHASWSWHFEASGLPTDVSVGDFGRIGGFLLAVCRGQEKGPGLYGHSLIQKWLSESNLLFCWWFCWVLLYFCLNLHLLVANIFCAILVQVFIPVSSAISKLHSSSINKSLLHFAIYCWFYNFVELGWHIIQD
jgi:hypothetical protein